MNDRKNKFGKEKQWYRYVITFFVIVMLLLLYFMIFHFSAQDGEDSSSLSQRITQKGVEIVNTLSGNQWSEEKIAGLEEQYEHLVRKTAHFAEYAYMGVLVFLLLSQWMNRSRKLYLLTVGWVFLSAAGDEFHQYFVPGRWASPWDVLLDTCGGIFGIVFCVFLGALYGKYRKKSIEMKHKNSLAGGEQMKNKRRFQSEKVLDIS